jgi:hypothetical protein
MDIELYYRDGQTDTTKLIVTFRDFSNASKHTKFCTHNTFMWIWKQTATTSLYNINYN